MTPFRPAPSPFILLTGSIIKQRLPLSEKRWIVDLRSSRQHRETAAARPQPPEPSPSTTTTAPTINRLLLQNRDQKRKKRRKKAVRNVENPQNDDAEGVAAAAAARCTRQTIFRRRFHLLCSKRGANHLLDTFNMSIPIDPCGLTLEFRLVVVASWWPSWWRPSCCANDQVHCVVLVFEPIGHLRMRHCNTGCRK